MSKDVLYILLMSILSSVHIEPTAVAHSCNVPNNAGCKCQCNIWQSYHLKGIDELSATLYTFSACPVNPNAEFIK